MRVENNKIQRFKVSSMSQSPDGTVMYENKADVLRKFIQDRQEKRRPIYIKMKSTDLLLAILKDIDYDSGEAIVEVLDSTEFRNDVPPEVTFCFSGTYNSEHKFVISDVLDVYMRFK